jgi:SAM-dependent methyltransferase
MHICNLCGFNKVNPLIIPNDKRIYYYCSECCLIFVDTVCHLDKEMEKKILSSQNQSIDKAEYVEYVNQIIQMVLPYINEENIGLDYGCGPSPTLTYLLEKENITCFNNDNNFGYTHPYKEYDFIFAIECLEKFKEPDKEFDKILTLLKPGGILGVMTETYPEINRFRFWHNRQDRIHVSYYHRNTISYFMDNKDLELLVSDEEKSFIFRKKG